MKVADARRRNDTMRTLAMLLALAPAAVHAQGMGPRDHPMMWGGGWLGTILTIVLVAAVVLVLLALARRLSGEAGSTPRRDDPLDILKARLARGEIDVEEYERLRRALER
jgi:putative membrane protein